MSYMWSPEHCQGPEKSRASKEEVLEPHAEHIRPTAWRAPARGEERVVDLERTQHPVDQV